MPERGYATPQALRQAVTDRLRDFARSHPASQLVDLQRQFAYDRLLCRVFVEEPGRWVVKGATAMLARLGSASRHTVDIDLYRQEGDLRGAEAALRQATAHDLGDHFRFTLSPGREITQGQRALRIPVTAYLGATAYASFHVDLVTGVVMTGQPDQVPPWCRLRCQAWCGRRIRPTPWPTTSPTSCARCSRSTTVRRAPPSRAPATRTWWTSPCSPGPASIHFHHPCQTARRGSHGGTVLEVSIRGDWGSLIVR